MERTVRAVEAGVKESAKGIYISTTSTLVGIRNAPFPAAIQPLGTVTNPIARHGARRHYGALRDSGREVIEWRETI